MQGRAFTILIAALAKKSNAAMQESDVNRAPDPPSRFKITGAKHGFKTHVFMCPLLSFHQLFQHCPTKDLEPSLFLMEIRWVKQTTEKKKKWERKKESVRAKVGRKGRIIKKKKTDCSVRKICITSYCTESDHEIQRMWNSFATNTL